MLVSLYNRLISNYCNFYNFTEENICNKYLNKQECFRRVFSLFILLDEMFFHSPLIKAGPSLLEGSKPHPPPILNLTMNMFVNMCLNLL